MLSRQNKALIKCASSSTIIFAAPVKTCVHLPVMKCFYQDQVMCTNVYDGFLFYFVFITHMF